MRDGHIEAGAGAANLLGGRDDGFRVAQDLAHGVAAGHVPQGAVLELAGGADDGALAVALDDFGIAAQRGDQRSRHLEAQRFEVVHEAGDVVDVVAGEGIVDHREHRGAAQRRGRRPGRLRGRFLRPP